MIGQILGLAIGLLVFAQGVTQIVDFYMADERAAEQPGGAGASTTCVIHAQSPAGPALSSALVRTVRCAMCGREPGARRGGGGACGEGAM